MKEKLNLMFEKKLHQKRDDNPILRGLKVPFLKPSKLAPDPKNQKKIKNNK